MFSANDGGDIGADNQSVWQEGVNAGAVCGPCPDLWIVVLAGLCTGLLQGMVQTP